MDVTICVLVARFSKFNIVGRLADGRKVSLFVGKFLLMLFCVCCNQLFKREFSFADWVSN